MITNPVIDAIVKQLVRALFIYFMGVLGAKAPVIYNFVNSVVHALNGQDAVIASLSGAVVAAAWGSYAWLKSKRDLRAALSLPANTSLAIVKSVAKDDSLLSVITNPPR